MSDELRAGKTVRPGHADRRSKSCEHCAHPFHIPQRTPSPFSTTCRPPPSAHTLRNRPRPPWLRPGGDDWGRREKYGNAVLATTDGQRRAQCPTSSERAKPYALKTQNAALKAGEHCALRCPDVGVSTHSIFLPPAAVPRPGGAKAAVADFVPLP